MFSGEQNMETLVWNKEQSNFKMSDLNQVAYNQG